MWILRGTTATAVLVATSVAVGQQGGGSLNLPTTEEWIGGFIQGGLQAADAVGAVRGRGLGSRIRRPLSTGRGRLGSRTMTYTTPSQTAWAYPSGYTTLPGNPLPPGNTISPATILSASQPSVWPRGIHIVNPARNQVPITFVIDGKPYTLDSGRRLELAPGTARSIRFDRGGRFGSGLYGLDALVFTFTPTQRGWELYQTPHTEPLPTNPPQVARLSPIQIPPPPAFPAPQPISSFGR
jgi:hypothetical protein